MPCGTCQLTLPVVHVVLPIAGGNASLPLAVPCDPALLGGQLQFQWWSAFAASSPCPLLPTAVISNSVLATIGS